MKDATPKTTMETNTGWTLHQINLSTSTWYCNASRDMREIRCTMGAGLGATFRVNICDDGQPSVSFSDGGVKEDTFPVATWLDMSRALGVVLAALVSKGMFRRS